MARGIRLGDNFDPDEIKQALESDEVMDACYELAKEVAEYWRSIAPVADYRYGRPNDKPGQYRASIKVRRSKRWCTVSSGDWKAHWIEYGTVKMKALAPRARTAAHFGGSEGFKITARDTIPKRARKYKRRRRRYR